MDIPYIKGKGIRDAYEIARIRTITAKEAKGDDSDGENDMRLAFELENRRQLFEDYRMIDAQKASLVNHIFIDTTFGQLPLIVKTGR